ncbi:TPA: hypothetical protein ACMWV7_001669 [Neisseria gonorrhoeae]
MPSEGLSDGIFAGESDAWKISKRLRASLSVSYRTSGRAGFGRAV